MSDHELVDHGSLSSLLVFRAKLADLLAEVDEQIRLDTNVQRLSPDEVLQRRMDNASTLGANLARVDGYATAADQDELRRYLEAHFDGEQHLVNEALSAARRVWHERRAAG